MLHLDARQRALLQEMGLMVWTPPATTTTSVAPVPVEAPTAPPVLTAARLRPQRPSSSASASAVAGASTKVSPRPHTPVPVPAHPTRPRLGPIQAAYPPDAALVHSAGAQTSVRWLFVCECTPPEAPMTGDAGRLLDNLLRALHLQYSREVFLCSVRHPEPESNINIDPGPVSETDAQIHASVCTEIQRLSPAVIVALGPLAARALLGSAAPLGQLRACVQSCAATPVVVTYPLSHLMRRPEAKSLTWADLCRAYALVSS